MRVQWRVKNGRETTRQFFGTEFGEGDATKQKPVKRSAFSQGMQRMKAVVRTSAGKGIQRRGQGHALKLEFFCAHALPKSQLLIFCPETSGCRAVPVLGLGQRQARPVLGSSA